MGDHEDHVGWNAIRRQTRRERWGPMDGERWPWYRRVIEDRYFRGVALGLVLGAALIAWGVSVWVVLVIVLAWALIDLVLP